MTMQSEVDAELLLEIKMKEVVRVRSVARVASRRAVAVWTVSQMQKLHATQKYTTHTQNY